jgi:hypothetical protein
MQCIDTCIMKVMVNDLALDQFDHTKRMITLTMISLSFFSCTIKINSYNFYRMKSSDSDNVAGKSCCFNKCHVTFLSKEFLIIAYFIQNFRQENYEVQNYCFSIFILCR